MDPKKRLYNDFNRFLKLRYGERLERLTLNTGFNCPNRQGQKSGCIYCLNGSSSIVSDSSIPLSEQIKKSLERAFAKKKPVRKFIAYFQAYTNTYAPPEKLFETFSVVTSFPEIKAVAIGTRPDCIDEEKLHAIKKAVANKDIWIEYGLQSVSSKTLKFIRRGHNVDIFRKAVKLTKKFGIETGAHVILGFPWETQKSTLRLARFLTECRIDHLKIHLLHILKGTTLEHLYKNRTFNLPSFDQYIKMAADLIEHLPPSIVIQRLTGEGTKDTHIAPAWALNKTRVIEGINSELLKRNSFQGKFA